MQTELIELVLKGKLKDPLARTFHPDAWRKEIEKIKTDEAQKLYENAILVRDYADAILRKLDTTIYKTAPASQMVNSLIAWANSLAFEFRRKHREQIAVAGKNTLSVFPRVTLAGGNQFNIADANTSLIDSLRLPLSSEHCRAAYRCFEQINNLDPCHPLSRRHYADASRICYSPP